MTYIAKNKIWKNGQFLTKTMGLPFWKNVNFSTFSTSCFYSLERCFFVLEYHKTHFPGLYCFKKKRWNNDQFLSKTMGWPLWKNVNFSTFSTSCFYCLEKGFFVLEYPKTHKTYFPDLYCLKKNIEKWQSFDQNHELTPLEKRLFFDFLNFLFLSPRKRFFCSRLS